MNALEPNATYTLRSSDVLLDHTRVVLSVNTLEYDSGKSVSSNLGLGLGGVIMLF